MNSQSHVKNTSARSTSVRSQNEVASDQQAHKPDYLNLPGVRTLAEPTIENFSIQVRAEQLWLHKCPKCGCDSRDFRSNGTRQQRVLDEPRGHNSVKILLTRRNFKCRACGGAGLLPLACLVERGCMTRRLLDYIEKESLLRPFREVAPQVGLSAKTVREIFKERVAECERTASFTPPRVLGIDGVYIERKERAILTDIERGTIIDIWGSVKTEPLSQALQHLPGREQIEVVTMDMARSLKNAVEQALPNAIIVIDRYHIQRMANESLDKVRKRLRDGVNRRNGQPTMCKSSLLRKHYGQLKEHEKIELKRWFSLKPELRLTYDLKEDFFRIWFSSCKATTRKRYNKWLQQLLESGLQKDFKHLLTAMNNWGEQIFNYFDPRCKDASTESTNQRDRNVRCTNAFTESTNRRVKDIQREARNGRFETVRAKTIYGTIVRQQLRVARYHEPNPNMSRAKRAAKPAMENLSACRQQTSTQLALF